MTRLLPINQWAVKGGSPYVAYCADFPEEPRWEDPESDLVISRVTVQHGGQYRLRLGTALLVEILPNETIIVRPRPGLPQITIDHFIADQVAPRIIANADQLVIHAGAVRINDQAILLMGSSGRGKSTLSVSFDRAGFPLLGDDAMIISSRGEKWEVRAVYPSLRLLPDSLDALLPGQHTSEVAHNSPKQRIDIPVNVDNSTPLSIQAIFSIGAPSQSVMVRTLSVAEACIGLVENSFALDPADTKLARGRLNLASALAAKTPTFEIQYPRDYSRLNEVREAILDQIASLEPS